MLPKPKHLGPEYASQFKDRSIATAYHNRPPYPDEIFTLLDTLITASPKTILDAGAGTGELARRLVKIADRVDAVDFSQAMIDEGKKLPDGNHPKLNWILGSLEEAPLNPPYALVIAGASLHWMDWSRVIPRFRSVLVPGGYLAITWHGETGSPWHAELIRIINRYSTNRDYQPYNLIEELERRNLFKRVGERITGPVPFTQSLESYIESIHSRNGFSRERMAPENARAFDDEVKDLLAEYTTDGTITLQIVGNIAWGLPLG